VLAPLTSTVAAATHIAEKICEAHTGIYGFWKRWFLVSHHNATRPQKASILPVASIQTSPMEDESVDVSEIKKIANASLNPLADAGVPAVLEVNGLQFRLEFRCLMALTVKERQQLFQQMETNVREFYEIEWGWTENERKKELFAADAKFLLVFNQESGNLAGWTMFKFDWDDLDEPEYCVLFCYELHVSPTMRGLSLGTKVT
jgi:hypothetical protein